MNELKEIAKIVEPRKKQNNNNRIPNVIVQTFETNMIPKNMIEKGCMTWIKLNPTYKYVFFDKNDRENFIRDNFREEVLETYHLLNHGSLQADLFRACYMYIKGGVYSDIDQPCIKPLDSIIEKDDDIVSGLERNTPHQMLLISAPKNPIFKHLIEKGIERVRNKTPVKGPWAGSGSGYFGPGGYTYSWICFHSDEEPKTDTEGKWIFDYKQRTGKYCYKNINFNVKNYSLFKDRENAIARIKYDGYLNDLKLLKINYWTKVKALKEEKKYSYEEFKNLTIIKELNNIIKRIGEPLEGNCLYEHNSNFKELTGMRGDAMEIKRKNLFNLARKSKNILEIGFNGGHSGALYFYANPTIKLLSFDICCHKYTKECANYLKSQFDVELIEGNSMKTVPAYNSAVKYDMIHIDGGHGVTVAEKDLINCKEKAHINTILVFDDVQASHLNNLLEKYISKGLIKEIDYKKNNLKRSYFHRIFNYNLESEIRNEVCESEFDLVYKSNRWGSRVLSGPGSTKESAKNIIEAIINIIKKKEIKKIIDGSCGDCNWIVDVLDKFPNIEYVGNDISTVIINRNKEKFKNKKNWKFAVKNILKENIESCDLFIFRHTMMHLKSDVNLKILKNIMNNTRYALLTNHPEVKINTKDENRIPLVKSSGGKEGYCWVRMNLHIEPYNMKSEYLVEEIKESSNNKNEYLNLYKFR